jgi:hypothetical protein
MFWGRYGGTEWRDDLRRLLKKIALEQKETMFLLNDTQIVDEGFLEVGCPSHTHARKYIIRFGKFLNIARCPP